MGTVIYWPVKIIFGVGTLKKLSTVAKIMGKKAMIVTYPDIRRIGLLDSVSKLLKEGGIDSIIFEKVEPNPRSTTVDEAAALVRLRKVDIVVGLGGGSAMDAAKAIVLASAGTKPVWEYIVNKAQPEGPAPQLIQIPTSAATGSESNNGALITNWETHEKFDLMNDLCWAQVAIVDPTLTLTVPRKTTAAGGIDILCHVLERYLTTDVAPPLNMGIREAVMKVVVKYLPRVLSNLDDIEGRTQLCWAASCGTSPVACIGDRDGYAPIHALEHTLSGHFDIPHGSGMAALLVPFISHIAATRKDRVDLLGQNVFGNKNGVLAVKEWMDSMGIPYKLRDMNVSLNDVQNIAQAALNNSPGLHMYCDEKAIEKIYTQAY